MNKFAAILLLILCIPAFSQQQIDNVFDFTLSLRGLTKEDLNIPINFDKVKSPTNDAKLILPLVEKIMKNTIYSFEFADKISGYNNLEFQNLIDSLCILKDNFSFENQKILNYAEPYDQSSLEKTMLSFCKENKKFQKYLSSFFTAEEKKFLIANLLSIISETENEDDNNSDIFKFNKARDSTLKISKRTMDLLNKDSLRNYIPLACSFIIRGYKLYSRMQNHNFNFSSGEQVNEGKAQGELIYYSESDNFTIAIGGKGKNIYTGDFDFIIDLGGDDVYNLVSEKNLFENSGSFIIDLSGDDYYKTSSDFCLAGSSFSSSFIFDKEGDDTYKGNSISLGSAICGFGLLYDESGNDTYQSDKFSIGAASFGYGFLIDKNGNDVYQANSYSQGFGMTDGIGAIVDDNGNDNYIIDARSLDIGRYEDHFISMSQGFGLGVRPYYAGGIGLIIEGGGNDFYATDIFGQGGAYWYALGCITETSGHDKYNSYQYAQGSGIHLAVGLLKDFDGWDFYTSDGVSQGCGHDLGFGLLYDVKGNDNYSAYSLSQGAGNANGIGIIIDESGRDGYLNKEPGNSDGYGNSRREYGSIGIFLDVSGDDFYSVAGRDSVVANSSMWGVMNDYFLKDIQNQVSGNNFKVELDSGRNFTKDEYFIMAKTIEPRFSKWQEYGFRKLSDDSINTAEYIMKYLDSDDHRNGLVLRNLSLKNNFTFGNHFKDKLAFYNSNMRAGAVFNQNQLAYICYLFGETRNPAGREELLGLTYDENIRVRASAVNALGKIIIDTNDIEFINKAAQRFRELASEKSNFKLFNKDLAFAFRNFRVNENIPALIEMMNYDFFGVRFLASENLKQYGDEYYGYISNNLLNEISENEIMLAAFLNSILNLSD